MTDGLEIIAATVMIALACLGIVHLAVDYRRFENVIDDCKTMGYVQNDKVRLECKVETR